MRNRTLNIALTAVLSLVLNSALFAQPKTITILHTNDLHASFMPREASWIRTNPKPLLGGFAELAAVVDSIRALRTTLVLDAGDVMTGNPVAELEYHGAVGGALFDLMNRIGYEAWTPGNHDYDISRGNYLALARIARFPIVCANLRDEQGKLLDSHKPYVTIEKNGLRIGIIGWMSPEFYSLVSRSSRAGIHLDTAVAAMQALINELDPTTDLIIALTHQGVDNDSVMATRLSGLDLIVGGHSHTRLRKPITVNGVVIVQAGSNAENLGVLDLSVENDHIVDAQGSLHQLWIHRQRPATDLTRFVDSLQNVIDKDYAVVIGSLATEWKRENGESGIGNFITDAQREAVKADVAFMNNHGIRADAPAGPMTKKRLFEILPFRNTLVTFPLTATQLRAIVQYCITQQARDRESIQTSGIHCRWKRGADGKPVITELLVNGAPVEEGKTYLGAASDYMMGESSRYLGIPMPDLEYTNQTVFAAVEQKFRAMQSVTSCIENRIEEVR